MTVTAFLFLLEFFIHLLLITARHLHCFSLSSNMSQFFVLNVMEGFGQLNDTDVQDQLLWIYEQTQNCEQKQPAVGLLTSDSRTEWSKAREKLLKGPIKHYIIINT